MRDAKYDDKDNGFEDFAKQVNCFSLKKMYYFWIFLFFFQFSVNWKVNDESDIWFFNGDKDNRFKDYAKQAL